MTNAFYTNHSSLLPYAQLIIATCCFLRRIETACGTTVLFYYILARMSQAGLQLGHQHDKKI